MTDVCKPVLSELQITGDWRVKSKLFVKFASSKKTEVKMTRQFEDNTTHAQPSSSPSSAVTVRKAVCK